jgi:hypothetical protein
MREATNKGWRLFRHGGHAADEASAAIAALRSVGPALILIHPTFWVELEGETYEDMARSGHESLNILVSWLPRGCTVDPAPWESVYSPLDARRRVPRRDSAATVVPSHNVELLKVRIAFARRYADLEAMGSHPAETLGALAEDMGSFETGSGALMAAACMEAAKGVRRGAPAEDLWGPHRHILGAHLVRMLIVGTEAGSVASGLRMAAETLESELRIALAERM